MTTFTYFASTPKGGYLANGTVTAPTQAEARKAVCKALGRHVATTVVSLDR